MITGRTKIWNTFPLRIESTWNGYYSNKAYRKRYCLTSISAHEKYGSVPYVPILVFNFNRTYRHLVIVLNAKLRKCTHKKRVRNGPNFCKWVSSPGACCIKEFLDERRNYKKH